MDYLNLNIDEPPDNVVIPLALTNIIYEEYDSDFKILDKPDQVYGRSIDGEGRIIFKNGNLYEGNLQTGMLHGVGKFQWKNDVNYEGDFKFNQVEGKGEYRWPDNSRYVGEVKAGLRHGQGTFWTPTEDAIYEGEWKDGLRHGFGKIIFTQKEGDNKIESVYEGNFQKGFKYGQGKMLYPSGNYYEGEWRLDKKDGFGTMNWLTTKEKYYGMWQNNIQNGFGVHIWLESKGEGKLLRNRYEGQWVNGQRHGVGTFYYANGSKYEGEWINNLKEGFSIWTEDNGNISQGLFKQDRKIVSGISNVYQPKARMTSQPSIQDDDKKNQKQQQKQPLKRNETQKTTKIAEDIVKSVKEEPKKKEIEENPFIQLIDVTDLTSGLGHSVNILQIHTDLQQMLLRYNSQMRNWYKNYSQKYDNCIGEDAFSMDLQTYWKFLKECKVLDSVLTIAAVNRLFFQGPKNNFIIKSNQKQLETKIELTQQMQRQLTNNEMKDITILQMVQKINTDKKIDWDNLEEEEDQEIFDDNDNIFDIHNGSRIILFRHFVELLVRTSLVKYRDIFGLQRGVEKLFQEKVIPYFNNFRLKTQGSGSNLNLEQDNKLKVVQELVAGFQKELKQIFSKIVLNNKTKKFGQIDQTAQVFDIITILQQSNHIKENSDKTFLVSILERYNDPDNSIDNIAQKIIDQSVSRSEVSFDGSKQRKKKQPKLQKQFSNNIHKLEQTKQERTIKMYKSEVIFVEFCELFVTYLIRKDHETAKAKESDKTKIAFEKCLNNILSKIQPTNITKQKEVRYFPHSIKDKMKETLEIEKEKQKIEEVKRKQKHEEKTREKKEREYMFREDVNVKSDEEEYSDYD